MPVGAVHMMVHHRGHPDFIAPGSSQHGAILTASKVASVLGLSRFQSTYTLWHSMRGNMPTAPGGSDQDIFRVGHAFEYALAELWRLENPGWKLSKGEVQYIRDDFGFPAMATIDRRASRGRARRVVEFKTARDLSAWGDPTLDGDCPIDFSAQVTFQMMVTGHIDHPAALSVMGPFFAHYTYQMPFDQKVANWIMRECQSFWNSLQTGVEPELDESVSTYECVKAQHPNITAGYEVPLPEQLALDLQQAVAASKEAETHARGLKSKVLDLMGDAQHGTVNGEKVVTRRPGARGSVSLIVR